MGFTQYIFIRYNRYNKNGLHFFAQIAGVGLSRERLVRSTQLGTVDKGRHKK